MKYLVKMMRRRIIALFELISTKLLSYTAQQIMGIISRRTSTLIAMPLKNSQENVRT
jgi:hypothetical protein